MAGHSDVGYANEIGAGEDEIPRRRAERASVSAVDQSEALVRVFAQVPEATFVQIDPSR
jgi:hypothetical protein